MKRYHWDEIGAIPQRGFSLVEVLVAVFIISIAVAGPLTTASGSIRQANYAKDQMIAVHLAQEAIEAIRQIRDTNVISNINWLTYLGLPSNALTGCEQGDPNSHCGIDTSVTPISLKRCSQFGACVLKYNTTSGFYNHQASGADNQPTIFTRSVSIRKDSSKEAVTVLVEVTWQTHPLLPQKSITVAEYLLDWQIGT
jgi:prepilin-type N-terminal cleavage/methylation domain-containing protein